MKKTVIVFGLAAGTILLILMGIMMLKFRESEDFASGEIMGYVSIIIALSCIFFGIRSYRDKQGNGHLTFGKGFLIGIYISLIATGMYIAGWDIYYRNSARDFMQKYTVYELKRMKESGASTETLRAKEEEMNKLAISYENFWVRAAFTFIEIFPLALVVSAISAFMLKKKASFSSRESVA